MVALATFTDSTTFADFSSSPQSASVNVGSATSDRLVFVYLFNVDGNNTGKFIDAVTIGGVTATKVDDAYFTAGDGVGESGWYWALVPSGTSATLSVTFTSTPTGNGMVAVVYGVTGADTTTPVSDANADGMNLGDPSAAITIPVDGVLLAGTSSYRAGAVSFNGWTNATPDQSGLGGTLIASVINMRTETGLSSTPGSPTVVADWSHANNFLSLVAIQAGAPPYSLLFNQQLRY